MHWSQSARPLENSGTNDAQRFRILDSVGRESTMSSGACKQSLLNPTQWFALTYAIVNAVNLREELTTLLVMKAMLVSALSSTCRFFPAHPTLASKISSTQFS
jgi:hypothetical protein